MDTFFNRGTQLALVLTPSLVGDTNLKDIETIYFTDHAAQTLINDSIVWEDNNDLIGNVCM